MEHFAWAQWIYSVAKIGNQLQLINPLMQNDEKWPNILSKFCSENTKLSMFSYFSLLFMKDLF